jgi:hypothetical protein
MFLCYNRESVVARGSGVLTSRDMINHLEALTDDNRYVSPMNKLIDYRLVENIILSTDKAWQIADKKKCLAPHSLGRNAHLFLPKTSFMGVLGCIKHWFKEPIFKRKSSGTLRML